MENFLDECIEFYNYIKGSKGIRIVIQLNYCLAKVL